MTVDLNTLMEVLLEQFGPRVTLEVQPMTESEKALAEENLGIVTAVRSRFILTEVRSDQESIRHKDLEERIIQKGRK
ncbi:hypothetical protein [Myxococcus sp. CA040A]|uniref:hypothetical protein n=1 Tax=Myxococcus sp. CA040A TaxID=2741738 RepID=UPI00157A42B6|nr:hypothetical protein [Myxococcus sp. CA040A]NTX03323.1 hypothetical protein [Myxococcus sp. CA040A]